MTKRMTHDLTYEAPATEVAAMLRDPSFRAQVCERQHVLRHEVSIEETAAGTLVVVDRVQAADGIPAFAAKFVGDEIRIVQEETWRAAEHADVAITIPGKPGSMSGTSRLRESAGVTTQTVDLEVRVSIPLVGGKIEGLVTDLLLKALRTEHAVGRDYLAG